MMSFVAYFDWLDARFVLCKVKSALRQQFRNQSGDLSLNLIVKQAVKQFRINFLLCNFMLIISNNHISDKFWTFYHYIHPYVGKSKSSFVAIQNCWA